MTKKKDNNINSIVVFHQEIKIDLSNNIIFNQSDQDACGLLSVEHTVNNSGCK